ncbi:uncharacterized protein LOC143252902 [Tachypleus tridentatus]|uniref:uncharacterized protein LOC143252902 n=1 Tax=Tachypleus tridentatus TaxID=6853 RepID=UPI003FD35737
MALRSCKHSPDAFCYVCGQFIKTRVKKYPMTASAKMYEVYKAYFGMLVGNQNKPWAPHFTCEHCKKTLEGWYRGEKRTMKFSISLVDLQKVFPPLHMKLGLMKQFVTAFDKESAAVKYL